MKSFGMATVAVSFLYIVLGIISLFMFGSSISPSILTDVADECIPNLEDPGSFNCPWESIVLRIMFLIVLACHIPFIFFSGKEGLLIVIDEIDRKSVSKALELKMLRLNQGDESIVENIEIRTQ